MTRKSLGWRLWSWVAGTAVGAAILALPDSGERVFSLSRTHGPSLLDLIGVALAVGCWLPLAASLPALWRAAGVVPARLGATLAVVGVTGLVVTISTDLGWTWLVAASMLVAAQVLVIVDGWRCAEPHQPPRG